MNSFDPAAFATMIALIGVVISLASVVSGLLDRTRVPPVALFILLGLVLGPFGLNLIDFDIRSPSLGAVATLSLVLVLFTDALGIDRDGLRQHLKVAVTLLGPGTILSAIVIGFAAYFMLGVSGPQAAILGAALASTDPVMMRTVIRRSRTPQAARTALGIESGLNDVVVLPIVLVAMSLMNQSATGMGAAARVAVNVFLLGPLAGAAIGFLAVKLLETMRGQFGLRRDYESLYVLGVAFTAYAAAEGLHGSGFMAAFAAGLTIAYLDVELCDCFQDYGAATSEMFLLFAFVAFGLSLIWSGLTVITPATLGFAIVALMARSLVLLVALPRSALDADSRKLVVWFGPRALSSLLLVLLPVFAGIEGAESLFPVTALVVLLSVVVHGAMGAKFGGKADRAGKADGSDRRTGGPADKAVTASRATGSLPTSAVASKEFITFDELRGLEAAGIPYKLLDVRTDKSRKDSDLQAKGSIRLPPDRPIESAAELALPKHEWLVAYCA